MNEVEGRDYDALVIELVRARAQIHADLATMTDQENEIVTLRARLKQHAEVMQAQAAAMIKDAQ